MRGFQAQDAGNPAATAPIDEAQECPPATQLRVTPGSPPGLSGALKGSHQPGELFPEGFPPDEV